MSSAYTRKKQPEVIREALLDNAMRIAVEQGLASVTVQAVAAAAGVTKGGLFHHFPTKQALIAGMAEHYLALLDAEIDARMDKDPKAVGRFTRAYVETMLGGEAFGAGTPLSALPLTALADPGLHPLWAAWIARRLERHRETDSDPMLAIVRLAADGAWLAAVTESSQGLAPATVRERLREMAGGSR